MTVRPMVPLVLTAAMLVPGGTASATPTSGPAGPLCGMTYVLNFPNALQGERVVAGPVVITDSGASATGELRCTVQIGDPVHGSTANDAVSVTSGSQHGLGYVPPTVVGFSAPPTSDVFLCTSFTYSTAETFYWDGVAKAWSTSDAVSCNKAVRSVTGNPTVASALFTACPALSLIPFFSTTARNLWGCNGGGPVLDDALVSVPDVA